MNELHLTNAEVDFILDFDPDSYQEFHDMVDAIIGWMNQVQDMIEDALDFERPEY
jgi:hypothetical protein